MFTCTPTLFEVFAIIYGIFIARKTIRIKRNRKTVQIITIMVPMIDWKNTVTSDDNANGFNANKAPNSTRLQKSGL